MKKKPLFWLLLPSYWMVTIVAIWMVAFYAFHSMSNLYFQALEKDIQTRAQLLGEQIEPLLHEKEYAKLDACCKRLGKSVETRFTIILPDGQVVADSWEVPAQMENHADRPEVRQALSGQRGLQRRYSRTVKEKMVYEAIPLRDDANHIVCAIRAALPMTSIRTELNAMTRKMVDVALVIGLLATVVCIFVVHRLSAPLRGMKKAARQFAEGDFSHRIPAQPALELNELAESLNCMSEQLSKTLSSLSNQRNEQQAVLSSMDEAVIAIDRHERIIHMNRIAGEILDVDPLQSKRALIQQVVHFANLQEFIQIVLRSQQPLSQDLTLSGKAEKKIYAHGTVLRNSEDQSMGALIVLRDVTQLRHLETVRADFVANVSHELKTPITSIKGFVETLLSSDWNHDPDILRFLEIINQQAERLNAIIDDLLILSRLEQRKGKILKKPCHLVTVISDAVNLCHLQAEKKKSTLSINCLDNLVVEINAPLFEQALVNLISNAIKYSDSNKTIQITAQKKVQHVEILVVDEGFGIEACHLDRLFERFYRVDTARSRKLGGTGLGLSIVKHIVQVHEGTIQVESQVGVGTTFIMTLPIS